MLKSFKTPFQVEKMGQAAFKKDKDDPYKCALFYVLMGKKRLLAGLFKRAGNVKVAKFLERDFSVPKNKVGQFHE